MVAFTFYEKNIIGLFNFFFFVPSKVLMASIILGVQIVKSLAFLCVFVVVVVVALYNACTH